MAPLRLKAPHHMEDICWKLLLRLLLSSQRFTLGQHEWEQRPPVGVKQQVGLQRRWDEGSSGFGSAELRSPKEAGVAWGGGGGRGTSTDHRDGPRPELATTSQHSHFVGKLGLPVRLSKRLSHETTSQSGAAAARALWDTQFRGQH